MPSIEQLITQVGEGRNELQALLMIQYQIVMGKSGLISNVLKTRHETSRNTIQNVR